MFTAIVRFSIKKKLFVGLTTLFLLIGGIYAMLTLPIDAVPDITNNQVQIVTVSPTLAPQEVEQLITMPIELAMSNIMNVEDIRSVSRFGLSVVTVVFKESVPTLDARQLINEQIQTVTGEIPPELGAPEMMPITTGLGEIYQYILKVAPGYEEKYDAMELRTIQDWMVKRQLSGIPGIVEINSFGGYLKQYEVAVDPDAAGLGELGLRGQHEAPAAGPARRRDAVRGRVGAPVVAHLVPVRREPEPLLGILAHLELELREHVRAGERRPLRERERVEQRRPAALVLYPHHHLRPLSLRCSCWARCRSAARIRCCSSSRRPSRELPSAAPRPRSSS